LFLASASRPGQALISPVPADPPTIDHHILAAQQPVHLAPAPSRTRLGDLPQPHPQGGLHVAGWASPVALRRAVLANHRTCARFTVFLETPNTRATSEIDNPSARHNRHDLRPILHTQHPPSSPARFKPGSRGSCSIFSCRAVVSIGLPSTTRRRSWPAFTTRAAADTRATRQESALCANW
jgi:hypothetical protein